MTDPIAIAKLIEIIQSQQKMINHLSNSIGSIGAIQFLIFRFLMQYDQKLALAVSEGLSQELDKPLSPDWPSTQHHTECMRELLKIAQNPTQRDEKGRPSWIRLVVDNRKPTGEDHQDS